MDVHLCSVFTIYHILCLTLILTETLGDRYTFILLDEETEIWYLLKKVCSSVGSGTQGHPTI